MDKHRKLHKYRKKDYTMLVEFPVEIVGRNGIVRTYSFEDSIRLYQRRIASAASRYDDNEVVEAEIGHCRQRIRQLRRSYFERYAWAAIRSLSKREIAGGEMAAEVAAFLARYAGSVDAAERYGIQSVESSGLARVWYLEPPGSTPLLLYLYRFAPQDDCPAKLELQAFVRTLEGCLALEDREHLHATHSTADCGLLLTGREPSQPREPAPTQDQPKGVGLGYADPVSQAVSMLRAGNPEDALHLLDSYLAVQPDHRNAALTAALAAGHVGSPVQAEMYVRLASAYHPGDAILIHQLGISLLQQHRLDEASEAFATALQMQPWLFPSRLLLALLALHHRRLDEAVALIDKRDARQGQGQADATRAVSALVRRARWRRAGLWGGGIASVVAAVWVVLGQPLAIPCFFATVLGTVLLAQLTRRPKPLRVAMEIARRVQVPREMLPPTSDDWEHDDT
jgi:Tfp pilus assembly protein PilF